MSSPIQFFCEGVQFTLKHKTIVRKWLKEVILEERRKPWYINFIFCDDAYLLELNKTYLKHETLTDILTFPYIEDAETISGDIFISIDRVRENAIKFDQAFEIELLRVIVHGVLHLIGYTDSEKANKNIMTRKEDFYLGKYNQKMNLA